MPSKRKKTTQKTVLQLTHKDLVRHTDGKSELVEEGDPEWNDGIRCINAYRSQATVLSQADQEEMKNIIRRLDYVVSPPAKNAPLAHTLMKAEYKKVREGGSLSWVVFIILKTVYGGALPAKYVDCVRDTFGKTEVNDHTEEYVAIVGTCAEPTEPSPESKKQKVVEISSPSSTSEDDDTSGDKDDGEGDRPTSPRQAEVPQHADGREGSAFDIGDDRYSTNKSTSAKGMSSPIAESNSRNRRDPTPTHLQTKTVTPEELTAKEGCDCTHGKLEKKIQEMFGALERKMDEKLKVYAEASTTKMDEKLKQINVYAEASTELLEIATGKRPAGPKAADV